MGSQVSVALTQIEKQRLGYQAISLTNFGNTSEPSIAAGSKIEVGSTLYEFGSAETLTLWGSVATSTIPVYMKAVPSGSTISGQYTTAAPTWSASKQGWYVGGDRYFGLLEKDASDNYANKALYLGYQVLYTDGGLIVHGSASIGFGVDNPTGQFEIAGSGSQILTLETTNTNGAYILFTESGTPRAYVGGAASIITGGSDGDLGLRGEEEILFATNGDNEAMRILANQTVYVATKIGIGINAVPVGGIGAGMVAIHGAASSVNGPHFQWTVTGDDYPLLQVLTWAHDQVGILFDTYFDGSYRSADAGSNFVLRKASDVFEVIYDSGVGNGSAITQNVGLRLNSSGGVDMPQGIDPGDNGTYWKTKIVEIGDWNMDANANVLVSHGLTKANIRAVTAMVRDDSDDQYFPVPTDITGDGTNEAALQLVGTANITLERIGSGMTGALWDATSYNRGWITLHYV
jgi:hypothetical protein